MPVVLSRHSCQAAEEAVVLDVAVRAGDAGGEEQGVGGSRRPAVAESQPPQAVNRDRLSM